MAVANAKTKSKTTATQILKRAVHFWMKRGTAMLMAAGRFGGKFLKEENCVHSFLDWFWATLEDAGKGIFYAKIIFGKF